MSAAVAIALGTGALLGVLLSRVPAQAGPALARLVDVRVAPHPQQTRVELELDGPARYRVAREPLTGGSGSEVVVRVEARGAFHVLQATAEMRLERALRRGLVASLGFEAAEPGVAGGTVRIRLVTDAVEIRHAQLADPPRIVIDVLPARPKPPETRLAQRPAPWPQRVEEAPVVRRRRVALTGRPEEKRPERPVAVPVQGRQLVIAGEYEVAVGYDRDRRLGRREDDEASLEQKLQLEFFYPLSEDVSLFAETQFEFDWDFYREDGATSRDVVLERGETWLVAERLGGTPVGVQLGRLNLRDEREWWWDENLDSIRLFHGGERIEAQLAVAQELAPEVLGDSFIDPVHDDVLRLLGSAGWLGERSRLDLFVLAQRDHSRRERVGHTVAADREDEFDADLLWLGLRGRRGWQLGGLGRLDARLDAGFVTGEERVADFRRADRGRRTVEAVVRRRVRGWALDGALSWAMPLPGSPALTLGYAVGSGDRDPDDTADRAFRQTGLHDNDGSLGIDTRIRYYGELFDPELSNLQVATAALEFPLLEGSGLSLLYHHYRQVHASRLVRDAGIRARPDGRSPQLGQELDLVLALDEWEAFRVEAVASVFRAGGAYAAHPRRLAFGAGLKFEFGF